MQLKYHSNDNGNCRVYFRQGRRLLCFQEGSAGEIELFRCSSDGEPDHSIPSAGVEIDRLPDNDCLAAAAFIEWWTSEHPAPGRAP